MAIITSTNRIDKSVEKEIEKFAKIMQIKKNVQMRLWKSTLNLNLFFQDTFYKEVLK